MPKSTIPNPQSAIKKTTPAQRLAMVDFIVSVEARRDKAGRLRVYKLPPADGGGTFEVAGINDRYHPAMAAHLAGLVRRGHYARVRVDAIDYLAKYTDVVTAWTTHPAIEAFLRDCCFNRGPKGALRILQIAIHVADDGKFGPVTRAALKDALTSPQGLLKKLRHARQSYEIRIAPPVGKRAAFWLGLQKRWDKAHAFAATFL